METRRLVVALAASVIVFILWMAISPFVMPTPPQRPTTQPAQAEAPAPQPTTDAVDRPAASHPASQQVQGGPGAPVKVAAAPGTPASGPQKQPEPDAAAAGVPRLRVASVPPAWVKLGSDDPNGEFAMMIKLNSRGASIDEVDLAPRLARYRNYPKGDDRADSDKDIDPFDSYDLLRPLKDQKTGKLYRSLTTQEINILFDAPGAASAKEGQWHAVSVDDKEWTMERRREDDRHVAVCTAKIEADRKPFLRVVKTYTLYKNQYDLVMDLRVESLDKRPHRVILTQQGPINVHELDVRGDSRKVYHGMRTAEGIKTGSTQRKDTVVKANDDQGNPILELQPVPLPGPDVDAKLVWAALGNQYFAAIMTPVDAERKADCTPFEATQVIHLTNNTGVDENGDLTFRFISRSTEVKPDEPAQFRFDLYVGPKERGLFRDAEKHPAYVERNYMGTIQEEYYFCVWTPLAELMTKLLIGLHEWIWPHNWGIAIIILVLVVRVILHPVTKKGQVSMTRMQTRMADLQPKLDELKKKYGNDRNKLNQETMAMYRKEGINPAGNMLSCLPMMLQMPIWVALWATLSNTIELRHASFMLIPGRWILDLTAPDALVRFERPVSLMFTSIDALNILPFLWGLSMILQQKLTPRPKPGRSSEQMQQQKRMMYIMAVVFTVMFYSFPSGLTLYIMASNFFGLLEQWRIRKHLEEERDQPGPPPAGEGGPGKKKPGGLAASLMAKFDKFDQEQRSIKGSKKK